MSEKIDAILPKISSPLTNMMPNSAIQAANKAIHAMLLESLRMAKIDGGNYNETKCCSNYQLFSPKKRQNLVKEFVYTMSTNNRFH